jgi:F-type H+-transporting ATPase subunit alpha
VLKQGQYQPVPVEEQVLVIYAVTEGHMDDVDPTDIPEFETGLREFVRSRHGALLAAIADTGELHEDEIVGAIAAFKDSWTPDGHSDTEEFLTDRSEHEAARAMRSDDNPSVMEE